MSEARLADCPAAIPLYLNLGPAEGDWIFVANTGEGEATNNRIAVHALLGLNTCHLRRRPSYGELEIILASSAIIPIHIATRNDVGPGREFSSLGYITLTRLPRERVKISSRAMAN